MGRGRRGRRLLLGRWRQKRRQADETRRDETRGILREGVENREENKRRISCFLLGVTERGGRWTGKNYD